jgi:hypothetical protein
MASAFERIPGVQQPDMADAIAGRDEGDEEAGERVKCLFCVELDAMNMLTTYLHQIGTALSVGNATEHTYRPALQTLLQSLETGIVATKAHTLRCA